MQLYDADPGPREVNVGTLDEPRIVDRHEHLLSVYARQLLQHLDANHARLDAVIAASRRTARHVRTLRGGWKIMQARRAGGLSRKPWQALTPWERASTQHTLTEDVLGIAIPAETRAQRASELATELRKIDEE